MDFAFINFMILNMEPSCLMLVVCWSYFSLGDCMILNMEPSIAPTFYCVMLVVC